MTSATIAPSFVLSIGTRNSGEPWRRQYAVYRTAEAYLLVDCGSYYSDTPWEIIFRGTEVEVFDTLLSIIQGAGGLASLQPGAEVTWEDAQRYMA